MGYQHVVAIDRQRSRVGVTPRGYLRQEIDMSTTTTFTVTGMTCGHCVAAVTEEVSKVTGVHGVDIDLASGAVTLTSDGPVDAAEFAAAVDEAGYEVAS